MGRHRRGHAFVPVVGWASGARCATCGKPEEGHAPAGARERAVIEEALELVQGALGSGLALDLDALEKVLKGGL